MNFVYDHISNDTSNDVGNDVKDIICGFTSLSSDKFHKEQPWACWVSSMEFLAFSWHLIGV
jgi:hypothetical protein